MNPSRTFHRRPSSKKARTAKQIEAARRKAQREQAGRAALAEAMRVLARTPEGAE